MCLQVSSRYALASAAVAASCLRSVCCFYIRGHLSKAGSQQQVCGFAHKLPLLSSPDELTPPAFKRPVQVSLCEVGQGFGYFVLLLHTAVKVASPGIKSMALSAVSEVGHGTLRFALLVFCKLHSILPAGPACCQLATDQAPYCCLRKDITNNLLGGWNTWFVFRIAIQMLNSP